MVTIERGVDQVDGEIVLAAAVDAAVVVAFEHGRPELSAPVAGVSALLALFGVPVGVAVASVVGAAAAWCELAAAGFGADPLYRAQRRRAARARATRSQRPGWLSHR